MTAAEVAADSYRLAEAEAETSGTVSRTPAMRTADRQARQKEAHQLTGEEQRTGGRVEAGSLLQLLDTESMGRVRRQAHRTAAAETQRRDSRRRAEEKERGRRHQTERRLQQLGLPSSYDRRKT